MSSMLYFLFLVSITWSVIGIQYLPENFLKDYKTPSEKPPDCKYCQKNGFRVTKEVTSYDAQNAVFVNNIWMQCLQITNPQQVCASNWEFNKANGQEVVATAVSTYDLNRNQGREFIGMMITAEKILIKQIIKGMRIPEKVCRIGPSKWITDRSTPCVQIGTGNRESMRVYTPSGMSNYYDMDTKDGYIVIQPKLSSGQLGLIQAECMDLGGKNITVQGNVVRLKSTEPMQCLITAALYKHDTRGFIEQWSGIQKQCLGMTCYKPYYSVAIPAFITAVGPNREYPFLLEVCKQNQANACFGGPTETTCS